jgi:hypothetical protein
LDNTIGYAYQHNISHKKYLSNTGLFQGFGSYTLYERQIFHTNNQPTSRKRQIMEDFKSIDAALEAGLNFFIATDEATSVSYYTGTAAGIEIIRDSLRTVGGHCVTREWTGPGLDDYVSMYDLHSGYLEWSGLPPLAKVLDLLSLRKTKELAIARSKLANANVDDLITIRVEGSTFRPVFWHNDETDEVVEELLTNKGLRYELACYFSNEQDYLKHIALDNASFFAKQATEDMRNQWDEADGLEAKIELLEKSGAPDYIIDYLQRALDEQEEIA